MHPIRRVWAIVLAVVITAGQVGCQANQANQPRSTSQALPAGPICDIIPRKPVSQLFGTNEMYALSKTNHLTDERLTSYQCTLSSNSFDPPYGKTLFITLRRRDEKGEPAAPKGVDISTPLGNGSVGPRFGYIYPHCDEERYGIYVHATEEVGKGSRAAVKQIALAVVDALGKAQNCREPTSVPSASGG